MLETKVDVMVVQIYVYEVCLDARLSPHALTRVESPRGSNVPRENHTTDAGSRLRVLL